MTPTEAVALCRFAKACCPQQHFDEFTPDAWAEVLGKYRIADCKQALTDLAGKQPFVSPAEIRDEVRRIRRQRANDFGALPDPPAHIDPDDTGAYHRWMVDTVRAIADGELTADTLPRALPSSTEPSEATAAFRELRRKANAGEREGLAE